MMSYVFRSLWLNRFLLIGSAGLFAQQKSSFKDKVKKMLYFISTLAVMLYVYVSALSPMPRHESIRMYCQLLWHHQLSVVYFMMIALTNFLFDEKVLWSEFFSDDPIRFVKNYARGFLMQAMYMTSLTMGEMCVLYALGYRVVFALPVFYMSVPCAIFTLLVVGIQSYLEEKLLRDVMHKFLHAMCAYFGAENKNNTWLRLGVSMVSAIIFTDLHLPNWGVVSANSYLLNFSRIIGMGCVWAWIYELEIADHVSENPKADYHEGIGVTSAMHSLHNSWIAWTHVMNDPSVSAFHGAMRNTRISTVQVLVSFAIISVQSALSLFVYYSSKSSLVNLLDEGAVKSSELYSKYSMSSEKKESDEQQRTYWDSLLSVVPFSFNS